MQRRSFPASVLGVAPSCLSPASRGAAVVEVSHRHGSEGWLGSAEAVGPLTLLKVRRVEAGRVHSRSCRGHFGAGFGHIGFLGSEL